MSRIFFILLVFIHGLIHIMGFAKAFGYAQINQITKEISRQMGFLWLLAMISIISAAIFYYFKMNDWWMIALVGVGLSQLLIIIYWQDAKFGTIANIIILIVVGIAGAEWRFENQFRDEVKENLTQSIPESLLSLESIAQLPEPVQRYIIYSGSINKPIPKNFKIKFEGQIRQDKKSAWIPFTCEQYNFINYPTRLFFMKANMKGLPVTGYHSYKEGIAIMDIRLFSLFTVQYQNGNKMDVSETVTWFNDLCLFAPGALIDKRITWETIDRHTVKAIFTYQEITISALLYFNDKGELFNFTSEDRYRIVSKEDAQQIRFSTPIKDFIEINDRFIPSYGETVWGLSDGDLTYGQFNCQDVQYNVNSLSN